MIDQDLLMRLNEARNEELMDAVLAARDQAARAAEASAAAEPTTNWSGPASSPRRPSWGPTASTSCARRSGSMRCRGEPGPPPTAFLPGRFPLARPGLFGGRASGKAPAPRVDSRSRPL